jgi:Raf kinase inhibitor-like YbhB/YbcL family protein
MTKSIVLVCDDPDAPRSAWVHWMVYDIPPGIKDLAENASATAELPSGAQEGTTDFGRMGYDGPCPPPGKPHRYVYRVYALDIQQGKTRTGLKKKDLLILMQGHLLAYGELSGLFGR